MASRQCILAMELEDIEREKFELSVKSVNIFLRLNCAIRYIKLQGNLTIHTYTLAQASHTTLTFISVKMIYKLTVLLEYIGLFACRNFLHNSRIQN